MDTISRRQILAASAAGGLLNGSALRKPQAGVGDDQPHASEAALQMLEKGTPAGPVLLGALADAENLPIGRAVHPDRNQQRHVENRTPSGRRRCAARSASARGGFAPPLGPRRPAPAPPAAQHSRPPDAPRALRTRSR